MNMHPHVRIIELTELSKEKGEADPIESEALVNAEGIVSVQKHRWEDGKPHIIGNTQPKFITGIHLTDGRTIHVKETVPMVKEMIARLMEV